MRRQIILLSIFLVSIIGHLSSQQSITGKLVDAQKQTIELVNVLIFKTSDTLHTVQGTASDSMGNFQFENIKADTYYLRLSLIGYKNKSITIIKKETESLNLGSIILDTDDELLQTIEITAKRNIIQKTSVGFLVKASSTLTQEGGTAIDLLRNTPTVFVDGDGNVNLRGKSPLILINGRNSKLTNLATIPASSIESIEIITTPTSQYDAEAENGIINIIFKKGTSYGTNGAFAAGVGYGAKSRINSSASLNHKKGNWNVGLGYDNRFANRARKGNGDRVNFNLPDQYYLTQRRMDDRNEINHNIRFNLDYENLKNIFNFETILAIENEDNYETLFSTFETKDRKFVSRNKRFSEELQKENVSELALNYERKFSQKDRKLFASITTSFNNAKENTNINTQNLKVDDQNIGSTVLQRTRFYEKSNITNFRLDYIQKIGTGTFEGGYKGILRFFDNEFGQEDQAGGIFLSNPLSTGELEFDEHVHAAYAQYKYSLGDEKNPIWEFNLGIRVEKTWNTGSVASQKITFSNNYQNLFPTAGATFHLNSEQNIRISYGQRINRPGLGQLNPFTDITDSLTQRSGNYNLKPEIVDNFEIGYSQDFQKGSISAKTFYRNGKNTILQFTVLRPDGVLFTKPENVGNTQTWGFEGIISYAATSFWQNNLSFSLFEQKVNAENIQTESINQVLSWNAKWINDVTCWKDAKIQIIGIYNSPTATIQGTRIAVYNVDMAFQQKLWGERARLGLIVTDVFDTQKNGFTWETADFNFNRIFKVDSRAFLLTLAYTFGSKFKEKLMDNKFLNE